MSAEYDPERIRGRLRAVRIERMFRVIHRKHRTRPLGAVPAPSRFSDPGGKHAARKGVRHLFYVANVLKSLVKFGEKRCLTPFLAAVGLALPGLLPRLPLEVTPLVEHADFLDALDEYEISLSEPPR